MISRISGKLCQINDSSALVDNNGLHYEVMLPSGLADRLKKEHEIGTAIVFETIYFIEAGDRKSSHYPRLVGFTNPIDREFFSLLTSVSGMGVKKALKSLVIPIKEIATAIEMKNGAQLNRLPGVGGRLAEKIIAELHGKTAKYALSQDERPLTIKATTSRPSFVEEAVEVLLQLGYRSADADRMVEVAIENNTEIKNAEDLITLIFKSEIQQKVGK